MPVYRRWRFIPGWQLFLPTSSGHVPLRPKRQGVAPVFDILHFLLIRIEEVIFAGTTVDIDIFLYFVIPFCPQHKLVNNPSAGGPSGVYQSSRINPLEFPLCGSSPKSLKSGHCLNLIMTVRIERICAEVLFVKNRNSSTWCLADY